MGKRRTNQEWQTLIEQSESSSLSTRAFCKLNELNPSTFYAKRLQLKKASFSQSFVRAEVVEKTTKYQAQIAAANMTLLVNDVELSIPQGTPAPYIAELIGVLPRNVCSALQRLTCIVKASILESPSTVLLR